LPAGFNNGLPPAFYWGIEMMTVAIITLLVVAVFYFAWDEISAARAAKKELNEAYWDERP